MIAWFVWSEISYWIVLVFENFKDIIRQHMWIFFRFDEKGNLEVLLFTIQSKMRSNNQRVYLPKEGRLISDINKAWERLEKAEHERELALREELIRYETWITIPVQNIAISKFTSLVRSLIFYYLLCLTKQKIHQDLKDI